MGLAGVIIWDHVKRMVLLLLSTASWTFVGFFGGL